MKQTTLDQFVRDPKGCVLAAQRERIVVTEEGRPLAFLVGIEHKDEEDARLEASPEFWQMIEERRRRPTVPLEEIEAQICRELGPS